MNRLAWIFFILSFGLQSNAYAFTLCGLQLPPNLMDHLTLTGRDYLLEKEYQKHMPNMSAYWLQTKNLILVLMGETPIKLEKDFKTRDFKSKIDEAIASIKRNSPNLSFSSATGEMNLHHSTSFAINLSYDESALRETVYEKRMFMIQSRDCRLDIFFIGKARSKDEINTLANEIRSDIENQNPLGLWIAPR